MSAYDLKDKKSIYQLLLKGTASSFAVKVSGAGLAFILQVFLARLTGIEEYGIYTYVIAWVTIATLLSPLGINRTAVKFIPSYITTKNYAALRSYIRWALIFTIISSVLVAAIAALGLNYSRFITDNKLSIALLIGFALIPINAVAQIGVEIIRAFRKVFLAEFANIIIRPMFIIIGIFAWYLYTNTAPTAENIIIANIITGLFVIVLLYRSVGNILKPLPGKPEITAKPETRLWLTTAFPLLFVVAGNLILGRTDIIMLGAISSTTDSGLYNAASRISQLIGFPLLSINMILAPMIAQLHSGERSSELHSLVKKDAWFSFLSCLTLAAFVFTFSETLLELFGQDFTSQQTTLSILLIGQIVSGAVGPAGYLLAMTGHQQTLAIIVAIMAILNIVLNYFLIPHYGTNGAAIATLSTIVISNITMAWVAIARIKINPSIFPIREKK